MTVVLTKELILTKCKCESLEEVKNLNLWGSDLEDISIVKDLVNVEVISLSVNQIKSLKPFSFCKKLNELYLRKNQVFDLKEILHLENCKVLKILWLEENPVCQFKEYRNYTIYHLPQLGKLDNNPISPSEKDESNLLFSKEINIEEDSLIRPFYNKASDKVRQRKNNSENTSELILKFNDGKNQHEDPVKNRVVSDQGIALSPTLLFQKNKVPLKANHMINFNLEEDYMNKFTNLEELTEFFSSPTLKNEESNKNVHTKSSNKGLNNSKGFTFNQSVKTMKANYSTSNFYKPHNEEVSKHSSNSSNTHLMKAINNLLEEMNLTQLNYIKRVVEKKLRKDYDSIL